MYDNFKTPDQFSQDELADIVFDWQVIQQHEQKSRKRKRYVRPLLRFLCSRDAVHMALVIALIRYIIAGA